MTANESLKAQRHQLYCSIGDVLTHNGTGGADVNADLLGRLQALLEAEACLSCVDGESGFELQGGYDDTAMPGDSTANTSVLAGAAQVAPQSAAACMKSRHQRDYGVEVPALHTPNTSDAALALQNLKSQLAQAVHHSVQQQERQHQKERKPRQAKFMSCSALLADLRAAQRSRAELEDQLEAAQLKSQHVQLQLEQEACRYKKAAKRATRLAEAANSRLLKLEQQLQSEAHQAAQQRQQLAEQAQDAANLRADLQKVKQHMQQLHVTVVQPLLHWQHQQQLTTDTGTNSTSLDSSGTLRAHRPWQPVANITPDAISAAAAAVEALLSQQAGHDSRVEVVLAHSQQHLRTEVSHLQSTLQETRDQLESARQEADKARQHNQELQHQLDLKNLQQVAVEQRCSSTAAAAAQQAAAAADDAHKQLQAQEQQVQELQQQVNQLTSCLACAQGEAAAAQRQVARLQEDHQEAAADTAEQLHQLQEVDDARQSAQVDAVVAAAKQELQLQHLQALAAAQQEAQHTLQQAQQAWQEQHAALERQHLQGLLRSRQVLEDEKQQWQRERDELIQQLTARYTASGMQAQLDVKLQLQELQLQVQQLQHERDRLQAQQLPASSSKLGCNPAHVLPVAVPGAAATETGFVNSKPHSSSTAASRPGSVVGLLEEPAAAAVQFSRALQTAETDRSAAKQRAESAELAAAELRQQVAQQEQELSHLRRALEELRRACAAANKAAEEAEASASASSNALQEQLAQVHQLQARLDGAAERHQYELTALRRSMAEQVRVIQADARAELEAAQTRLQLVRLKQQRMAASILSKDAAEMIV